MGQQRQDYVDALHWVTSLMAETPSESLEAPTPCADFDVRALLGHLIGTAHRGLATARRRPTRGIPHVVIDVPDADLTSTYAGLAASIETAWLPLAAADEVVAPWGPCSAVAAARGFTVETITHGWDLAVATGQPTDAPYGIADRCLSYADAVVPDRLRGVMYDPPVVEAGALSTTEPVVYFPMVWSRCEEVSAWAARLADEHRLNCYDPQHSRLRTPAGKPWRFELRSARGRTFRDPDPETVRRVVTRLSADHYHAVLTRADGWYIQAGHGERAGTLPGRYALERQDGSADRQFRTELTDINEVVRGFVGFLENDPTLTVRFLWRPYRV